MFQVWALRALIEVCSYQGALGLCAQAAEPLLWMHTDAPLWACAAGAAGPLIRLYPHPGFQVWDPGH